MDIRTHQRIDAGLCGQAEAVGEGTSRVRLTTDARMAVDDRGLVHGGFVFGLADYAAMIAVNHPNVVLGAADVKFLAPVKVGDTVVAEARVEDDAGRKRRVAVNVRREDKPVFEGRFTCFVLDAHVLGGA
jgi:uncharacterized protein (TIGR00369 family)